MKGKKNLRTGHNSILAAQMLTIQGSPLYSAARKLGVHHRRLREVSNDQILRAHLTDSERRAVQHERAHYTVVLLYLHGTMLGIVVLITVATDRDDKRCLLSDCLDKWLITRIVIPLVLVAGFIWCRRALNDMEYTFA